ncbi:MAG: hypothetical protein A3F54_00685 [Candidatus Kerfeldbacteria bacterium RIFCSPHIGHO2_12_FULL_48_17]|uniref:Uncharacterized protein n=1 Tax=Candidatus Kerfeldbacteria bacterium RIFCSPHIGHO2_12_FULL_48_17 TaxID=1798542 RepID=A0A1G2B859_9BACT|nr:MAG: hypothetical protein A3F54_00685 [Candidatus Kerfeldbacteria bacterium RIFCSPHIGHO2_12_FULL_48_17]
MEYFSRKNQKGITLLETTIAVAIILTGVIAVITLLISTRRAGNISEQELVATNLAREGIEIVRQQRDSNWLAISSGAGAGVTEWDTGLTPPGTNTKALAIWDTTTNTWSLDFSAADFDQVCGDHACSAILQSGGKYIQSVTAANGSATPTVYQRLLTFKNICRTGSSESPMEADCSTLPGSRKVGVEVEANVRVIGSNNTATYSTASALYNWKPGIAD